MKHSNHNRFLLKLLLLGPLAALLMGVLLGIGYVAPLWMTGCFFWHQIESESEADSRRPVPDPVGRFEQETGLSCAPSTRPIFVEDTHGGFHFDGDLTIALKVDKSTIDGWLKRVPPPFSDDEWQPGPLTPVLSKYFSRELAQSPDVWYVAKNRNASPSWYNGTLLILDPKTCEAWLYIWDM